MKAEQDVAAALRALADSDEALEASPELETRVRSAFRARRARRKWKLGAAWTLAAAAAAALATFLPMFNVRQPRPQPEQVAAHAAPAVAPAVDVFPARVVERPNPRRIRARPPREIMTEFFPLMEAPPPMDRGELFRVSVPAAAMRTVGLPVSEDRLADRVQADVLVSEEGLATAIRFVKYE